MAKQTINLGAIPSGSGGDTQRSAFTKTQANFDEIYTALGGTTIPSALPVAKGGTGGTTAAAARTALGLKTAAVADIVGTSATGAIIERGSNANGEWTKFADGTMICMKYETPYVNINQLWTGNQYYTAIYWTFPVAFAGNPPVTTLTGVISGRITITTATNSGGVSSCGFFLFDTNGAPAGTFIARWLAIGRWF